MSPTNALTAFALCVLTTSLLGCATSSGDGAGSRKLNPVHIKDAEPKAEPQTRAGNPPKYEIKGKKYTTLKSHIGFKQLGYASWYGTKFHGRPTSNGEKYDMYAMTAAHKTLPIPCYVRVTRQDNGKSIVVRVNDRGPFVEGRIIDLSYAAATKLGITESGTAKVHIEAIDAGKYRSKKIRKTPPASYTAPQQTSVYDTPPSTASALSFDPVESQTTKAPAEKPVPTATTDKPVHAQLPRGYFIQLAAFQTFDNALAPLKRLRAAGLQPLLVQLEQPNFPFKIWIGPYGNKAQSIAVKEELRNQGHGDGFIVRN